MANYSKKLMGKEVGSASVYAEPHTMKGEKVTSPQAGRRISFAKKKDWQPMDGVSMTLNEEKTDGIKIRGTGAATKGVIARGPMG